MGCTDGIISPSQNVVPPIVNFLNQVEGCSPKKNDSQGENRFFTSELCEIADYMIVLTAVSAIATNLEGNVPIRRIRTTRTTPVALIKVLTSTFSRSSLSAV